MTTPVKRVLGHRRQGLHSRAQALDLLQAPDVPHQTPPEY